MITVDELNKIEETEEAEAEAKVEQYFANAIKEENAAGFKWKYFSWNAEILRSEIKPFLDKLVANGFKVVITRQNPVISKEGNFTGDVIVDEVFVYWGK